MGTVNNCILIIYFKNALTSTEIMKSSTTLYTHYIIIHNNIARAIFADVVVRKPTTMEIKNKR